MDGILLADKPIGVSSYDVIRRLKSLFTSNDLPVPKLGHAGTLDPLASGLLIILIGKATKAQDIYMKQDKVYQAVITLGAVSTTDDAEGAITRIKNQELSIKQPTLADVTEVLKGFEGEVTQLPPTYSAIKINGQRAYKLARQSKEVVLKARPVKIYKLKLLSYKYPVLKIAAHVGSGTYIRSLARDIGQELGTGAYLGGLRRTSIGEFLVADALSLDDLSVKSLQSSLKAISA